MGDGVGGRLGDDQFDSVVGRAAVRRPPGVHLLCGEPSGEAGAAWGRGEPEGQRRLAVVAESGGVERGRRDPKIPFRGGRDQGKR
jgi:hypothetical protein